MKIWMMTDIEGVAGILNFEDWCSPGSRYYEIGKRLLTREVNAAVDGFFAGGADAVMVIDGHGPGAIDLELLDERATVVRGSGETPAIPKDCDAVAYVGQHAKAGTPYSHLTHTGTFAVVERTVNGVAVGEYGDGALLAAENGIPVIFASGEAAFCREAEELTPGVVTVPVKWGLLPDDGSVNLTAEQYAKAKLAAEHLAPAMACKRIAAGAKAAVAKFFATPKAFQPCAIKAPFHIVSRFRACRDFPPQILEAAHPARFSEALRVCHEQWNLSLHPEKPLK